MIRDFENNLMYFIKKARKFLVSATKFSKENFQSTCIGSKKTDALSMIIYDKKYELECKLKHSLGEDYPEIHWRVEI